MGWARFDDGYMDHPKIYEAGPWAELLDRRAIEHCAKYETDGLVSRSALKRISRGIPKVADKATTLVNVGRWTVNADGGWFVHDFLAYNPSKAAKNDMRERARVRQASRRGHADVTTHSQGEGRGSLDLEKRASPKMVEYCSRCGKIEFDCACPKLVEAG